MATQAEINNRAMSLILTSLESYRRQSTRAAIRDTWLYVRICLPSGFDKPLDPHNSDELTLSSTTLKFDVAYRLIDEYIDHVNNPDNGFTLCSFRCHSKKHAEIIQDVTISDFRRAILSSENGYLDTTILSHLLEMPSYSQSSYDDYVTLADKLFVYMVRMLKRIWPNQYPHHGQRYCDARSDLVELSSVRHAITRDMANSMGMGMPVTDDAEHRARHQVSLLLDHLAWNKMRHAP